MAGGRDAARSMSVGARAPRCRAAGPEKAVRYGVMAFVVQAPGAVGGAVDRDGGYGQMARIARLTGPDRNAEKTNVEVCLL